MGIFKKHFWYIPAIVWMFIIFRMSGQAGKISSGISYKVTEFIVDIIEIVRRGDACDAIHIAVKLHPYVRKLAHMAEFGILDILLTLSFMASARATMSMVIAIIVSFAYACLDEFHQTFVTARSGQLTDVCIDMMGVLGAVTLMLFIYSIWQKRKMR